MKRFASHYLHVPETGFLKHRVVEVEEDVAVRYYPLSEEIESVEWRPGVIDLVYEAGELHAYLLYPFDFITMQPVAGTRRIQLK